MNTKIPEFLIEMSKRMGKEMTYKEKLFHFHKYTELRIYPPRPEYGKIEFGFLLACECGKVKLTGFNNVLYVNHMMTGEENTK